MGCMWRQSLGFRVRLTIWCHLCVQCSVSAAAHPHWTGQPLRQWNTRFLQWAVSKGWSDSLAHGNHNWTVTKVKVQNKSNIQVYSNWILWSYVIAVWDVTQRTWGQQHRLYTQKWIKFFVSILKFHNLTAGVKTKIHINLLVMSFNNVPVHTCMSLCVSSTQIQSVLFSVMDFSFSAFCKTGQHAFFHQRMKAWKQQKIKQKKNKNSTRRAADWLPRSLPAVCRLLLTAGCRAMSSSLTVAALHGETEHVNWSAVRGRQRGDDTFISFFARLHHGAIFLHQITFCNHKQEFSGLFKHPLKKKLQWKDTPNPVWVCCWAGRLWPPGSSCPPDLWAWTWWWDDPSSTFSQNPPLGKATEKISEIIFTQWSKDVSDGVCYLVGVLWIYDSMQEAQMRHWQCVIMWMKRRTVLNAWQD